MKEPILILGAQNSDTGELDANAIARAETAFQLYHSRRDAVLIVTGRRGAHFNLSPRPHCSWMAEYLIRLGTPAEAIAGGVLSGNTVEDAVFARQLLAAYGSTQITLVTSHFHMPRAALVFRCVYPEFEVETCASEDALPTATLERRLAHEQQSIAKLIHQGGVLWHYRLFPLPAPGAS